MRKILLALALTALGTGAGAASDKTDVWAVVQQFVVGFNKGGDMKEALAVCADETSIIDVIPPGEWHSAGACSKWLSDWNSFSKTNKITDAVGTLGKPRHIYINGDHAYVVAPAAFSEKVNGKAVIERGSTFTVALQRGHSGWRITGWTYSEGRETTVKTDSAK